MRYYFFFTWERGEKVRESSQGVGSDGCREGEVRSSGLGVPTSATSHCEIAGAHNFLVAYVIFLRKKKNLFKILKVLPVLPQTLKKHLDVGYHPRFSLSSK